MVLGLLLVGASLVAERRLQGSRAPVAVAPRLQSTGSVAVAHGLSWSMAGANLPRPGIKPVSPTLAGGFFTTEPPGKPWRLLFLPISTR